MNRADPMVLNRKFIQFPAPSVAILELTNRCNHGCVHCVRESPAYYAADDMTEEHWHRVLDELAAIKTFAVCFTGGEATTFPGLLPLIRHARRLRMCVSLKSNGILLQRLALQLADAGVGHMDVSLYGATAATHERCTRIAGSFEKTIEGIKAVRAKKIPVSLSVTLFRWNVHELEAMRALAGELDCSVKRDYFLMNSDLGRNLDGDFLTPEQIRLVEARWPGATLPSSQNGTGGIKICAQGMNTLAVTARGEILTCVTIRKPIGHVRREGLIETWQSLHAREEGSHPIPHDVEYDRFSRCSGCQYVTRCHTCLGHSHAATGMFHEPPLERCLVTMALYGSKPGPYEAL